MRSPLRCNILRPAIYCPPLRLPRCGMRRTEKPTRRGERTLRAKGPKGVTERDIIVPRRGIYTIYARRALASPAFSYPPFSHSHVVFGKADDARRQRGPFGAMTQRALLSLSSALRRCPVGAKASRRLCRKQYIARPFGVTDCRAAPAPKGAVCASPALLSAKPTMRIAHTAPLGAGPLRGSRRLCPLWAIYCALWPLWAASRPFGPLCGNILPIMCKAHTTPLGVVPQRGRGA